MYRIIKKSDNSSIALVENLVYIKLQNNGRFIVTDEESAQGIVVNGRPYQLINKKKLNDTLEEIIIVNTNSGELITDIISIQDNTDDLMVDQEYRLTLLELGVIE